MKALLNRLLGFLAPGIILKMPAGVTPDNAANFGFFGFLANANNYSITPPNTLVTAGTAVVLTAAQAVSGFLILGSGASGAFTITLPSTASIIAALGPTIPTDGTYCEEFFLQNLGVGQTGTLTAGDASTTISGTATLATNTTRLFLLTVLAGGTTISITNLGSLAL